MSYPPTSLYIHIPWCVKKCPYCDFNSHQVKQDIPESAYIQHLLDDLRTDIDCYGEREIYSIFIGGGTPSLFSPEGIDTLLTGIKTLLPLKKDAEITLEANPGTLEVNKFIGFRHAGVNRISIGVQSFEQEKLTALGRIHDHQQALNAAEFARQAGLQSFNIDLMHGLPNQKPEQALSDLQIAINQDAPHISWYQLTIEPNTQFYSKPPTLPSDDILWDIQERGQLMLQQAGYIQYEVSGYAKLEYQCQHNLNYWRFGDYFGIGCGAHGKITVQDKVIRTSKHKHPKGYMDLTQPYIADKQEVKPQDLPFEYLMNHFRLFEPCPKQPLFDLLGPTLIKQVEQKMAHCEEQEWITQSAKQWQITLLGHRYLNSLLTLFLAD